MTNSIKNEEKYYYPISTFYKQKFGEKVYKIPIGFASTCPNRDGFLDNKGCIYCGTTGGSFENSKSDKSIFEQYETTKELIKKKYNARLFIPYFMSYSNTYTDIDSFKKSFNEILALNESVGLSISTRPDLIFDDQLLYIKNNINNDYLVTFELGLQSVNNHTLEILNRKHYLSDFIDACLRIKSLGYRLCVHLILDLPWDNEIDIIEAANIMNVLNVDEIKIHSLYVVKGTHLAKLYQNNEIKLLTEMDYIKNVSVFLSYLNPQISISRIVGRAPEENTLYCNWNKSWWKIKEDLLNYMEMQKLFQGKNYKKKGGNSYGKDHFR